MKIRNGFVSNSSSSSFICEVCGNVESGMDLNLSDVGMCECVNGHTFCRNEAINIDEARNELRNTNYILDFLIRKGQGGGWYKERADGYFNELNNAKTDEEIDRIIEDVIDSFDLDDDYSVPESACPICTLTHIPDYSVLKFLEAKKQLVVVDIEQEIRKSFSNSEDLYQFINKERK